MSKWVKTTEFGPYLKPKKTTRMQNLIREARRFGLVSKHAGSKTEERILQRIRPLWKDFSDMRAKAKKELKKKEEETKNEEVTQE